MADNNLDSQVEAELNQGDADGLNPLAAEQEIEAMKAQLAEMEKEAAKTAEEDEEMPSEDAEAVAKDEIDSRSVYVGNVDYSATPEELQKHFQACGTVNRVTILTDRGGNPKGFAFIEFLEPEAVEHAILLDQSELKGRTIKVSPKRTNVPGLKQTRGRGRGRGGGGGRGVPGGYPYAYPMMMPPFMFGGAYGFPPRGRGRGRGGRGRGYTPY